MFCHCCSGIAHTGLTNYSKGFDSIRFGSGLDGLPSRTPPNHTPCSTCHSHSIAIMTKARNVGLDKIERAPEIPCISSSLVSCLLQSRTFGNIPNSSAAGCSSLALCLCFVSFHCPVYPSCLSFSLSLASSYKICRVREAAEFFLHGLR
jgi:hypothetical protein